MSLERVCSRCKKVLEINGRVIGIAYAFNKKYVCGKCWDKILAEEEEIT